MRNNVTIYAWKNHLDFIDKGNPCAISTTYTFKGHGKQFQIIVRIIKTVSQATEL